MQAAQMQREYLTAAETAKLVRQALKATYPGTKFSVTSKSYSGGASIRVRWTDGPTDAQVSGLVKQFEGADFDGMIDLKTCREHWLLPDGRVLLRGAYGHSYESMNHQNAESVDEAIQRQHPGARAVRFAADYVFTERDISDEFAARVAPLAVELHNSHGGREYCHGCGVDLDEVRYYVPGTESWKTQGCSPKCAGKGGARQFADTDALVQPV